MTKLPIWLIKPAKDNSEEISSVFLARVPLFSAYLLSAVRATVVGVRTVLRGFTH
jgi:hypothetical protein